MSSINNRYTLLPLPGQLEERPTTRPRAEARSTVRPMKPDDFEARQDKFLKNLRSDPIILDRSSGEYAPILNFTSAPLRPCLTSGCASDGTDEPAEIGDDHDRLGDFR
jgi:hypothetical protein